MISCIFILQYAISITQNHTIRFNRCYLIAKKQVFNKKKLWQTEWRKSKFQYLTMKWTRMSKSSRISSELCCDYNPQVSMPKSRLFLLHSKIPLDHETYNLYHKHKTTKNTKAMPQGQKKGFHCNHYIKN